MRVLIACEFSGTVRDAFIARGHTAISCDIVRTTAPRPGTHIIADVRELISIPGFSCDLMIAFPPCTYLTSAAGRHYKNQPENEVKAAINLFLSLYNAPFPRIAIENPTGKMRDIFRAPDQVINPWQFGSEYQKRTCLWLKNLPILLPTHTRAKQSRKEYVLSRSKSNRQTERSKTFPEIAEAMAEQWGTM